MRLRMFASSIGSKSIVFSRFEWCFSGLTDFNHNAFLYRIIHYGSPAIDILYNLFSSTDKELRSKEYDSLIQLYYSSLSKTVKLLGSNPDELFTFADLMDELKHYGVYALLMVPMLLQVSQAHSNEISNMDEMFDKVADGENKINLITGLSSEGQSEYERRINEVFEDIIEMGYYQTQK